MNGNERSVSLTAALLHLRRAFISGGNDVNIVSRSSKSHSYQTTRSTLHIRFPRSSWILSRQVEPETYAEMIERTTLTCDIDITKEHITACIVLRPILLLNAFNEILFYRLVPRSFLPKGKECERRLNKNVPNASRRSTVADILEPEAYWV